METKITFIYNKDSNIEISFSGNNLSEQYLLLRSIESNGAIKQSIKNHERKMKEKWKKLMRQILKS